MSGLFHKHEPCCAVCVHGTRLSDEEVGCVKRGVIDAGGSCRAFRYDPLLREPSAAQPIKTHIDAEL